MDAIKRLLGFLSTLWGLLAAAAIAFPGAAALLKVPVAVSESTIAALYPVIGTIVSAFATLFLIAYKEELKTLAFARRLAIWGMAIGLVCFFSFVSVRIFVLDVKSDERVVGSGTNSEVRVMRNSGVIAKEITQGDKIIYQDKRGDPYDILALALFTATFASLTFGFTALGIYTYQSSRD